MPAMEPTDHRVRLTKLWMQTNVRALIAEGLDPDDPQVIPAIDWVRWELSLMSG